MNGNISKTMYKPYLGKRLMLKKGKTGLQSILFVKPILNASLITLYIFFNILYLN